MARRRERGARSGPMSAELIEQEAVRLFGERSYPVVGMRDIAEAVGLLPGSLYVHISKKEDLLVRIVERGIQNYLDRIEPIAASDAPATTRIRESIKAHMEVLADTLEQTKVTFNQWAYLSPENQALVVELRRRYEQAFTAMVRDGVESGEFAVASSQRIAVLATIGMLNATAQWYVPQGRLSPAQIGDALADHALKGLEARPAGVTGTT